MREYFHAYHSILESIEPLDDAERGRLFTALLSYSATGETPLLTGNERFLFPALRGQIDRDRARYEERCAQNRRNGALGGRPPRQRKRKKKRKRRSLRQRNLSMGRRRQGVFLRRILDRFPPISAADSPTTGRWASRNRCWSPRWRRLPAPRPAPLGGMLR